MPVSTGKRADNRPDLQVALGAIAKDDALVVYSLSRQARSTRDTLDISDMLTRKGADLVSITEKIDTTTAAGKMKRLTVSVAIFLTVRLTFSVAAGAEKEIGRFQVFVVESSNDAILLDTTAGQTWVLSRRTESDGAISVMWVPISYDEKALPGTEGFWVKK